MNFKDFLAQYNNKFWDFDKVYGNQCVDLVQFWVKNLGLSPLTGGYAYLMYYNFDSSKYTRIPNGPDDIPKEGDIPIWSWYYNYAGGHIGIATGKGDVWSFECFEQNDPSYSNSHLKTYKYDYVLGWLRPKNYNPTPLPLTDTQKLSQIKIWRNDTTIPDSDFRYKVKTLLV